jgi:hypothetical protein
MRCLAVIQRHRIAAVMKAVALARVPVFCIGDVIVRCGRPPSS